MFMRLCVFTGVMCLKKINYDCLVVFNYSHHNLPLKSGMVSVMVIINCFLRCRLIYHSSAISYDQQNGNQICEICQHYSSYKVYNYFYNVAYPP